MAYERGRTGADLAAREAAQRQREAVDRLMERQAEREMRTPVAIVDAPTEYVREVMPQAVADIGAARAVQGATRAREDALQAAAIIEKAPGILQSAMGLLGYNPREAALAQTERLMRMPGATFMNGRLTAPIAGAVGAFGRPASLNQGMFGNITYTGMPYAGYAADAPFADLIRPAARERGDGRPDVVQPVADAMTGQQRCPDGYEFDANLNACRRITPSDFGQTMTPPAAVQPDGRYARMGLLDQPPAGLLEAGFGSPADFTARNLAFRRSAATVPSYFTDPRSYEGYTLI